MTEKEMKKDIGVAVVGLGMGQLAGDLNLDPSTRLAVRSVCSVDPAANARFAERFGVPHATAEFNDVLKKDDVDIVAIYTPDKLHASQILAALNAGKHVMVTKPMVNTMAEVAEVVQAVRRTGKKLLVGETFHFDLPNVAAKKLVDSGRVGCPILIQSAYIHDMRPVIAHTPWRKDPTDKIWMVGAICHAIDYQLWFGGDVEEVSAYANDSGTLAKYGRAGDNNFIVNLKFKNGAIGRILGVFGIIHPPGGASPFAVFCSKGSIVGSRYTVDSPGSPNGVQEFDLEVDAMMSNEILSHGGSVLRYFRHFEDCILNDKTPCCDVIVGAKTAAVSWAALESIETGKSVKVRNDF